MGERVADVTQRSASRAGRDGLYWAATISGTATGLLVFIVALRIGLIVLDRQMRLSAWVADLWYHVGNASDTAVFTLLYVAAPIAWVVTSVWWWLARFRIRWRFSAFATAAVVVAVGLPGAWAWFVTALWQVQRVVDIDGIPRNLVYWGITDTDYWGVAVVAGLMCAAALALADLAARWWKTTSRG